MAKTVDRKIVEIPDFLTVRDLAELMDASPIDVIKELMGNGIMASINQQIDYETAAIVAVEMGFEPHPLQTIEAEPLEKGARAAWRQIYIEEDPKALLQRPPVVAVLGHVDHGKTSLLDRIRASNVQAGEAGGITQHIGAYQIDYGGRKITFLDTPGHEAFTAMRARGAQGADIVVLVVAADDGVMPQTREAISHAQAASVPILVALNKIDRSNARAEHVKQQLADIGLVPDDWDGDTIVVPVSAKTEEGLEDLLEAILLVADDTEIKANPNGKGAGTVIEAELDRFRGIMVTLLVQNGMLKKSDVVLAGKAYGRLKAMFDQFGNEIDEAGPSAPVRVMGLNEIPEVGTVFEVVKSEKEARAIVQKRKEAAEADGGKERPPISLEELYARFREGEAKELNLIIKADVRGSLEPIIDSMQKLSIQEEESELKVNVMHADVGTVNESDVMLASASDAIIVGFQIGADTAARRRADSEGVEIRFYDVIYELIDEIEQALEGLLEPIYEDVVVGLAEVREVFRIPKVGQIAGCYIREGEARRNSRARLLRDHQVIYEGGVSSLRRYQEDVREVRTGFECGIGLEGFSDFDPGDIIQFITRKRVR